MESSSSQVEFGDRSKEVVKAVQVVREQSPILLNLSEEPSYVQRFAQITNGLIGEQGGGIN